MGIAKAVAQLRYDWDHRDDHLCTCGVQGCSLPSLRSRIVDGITVTWEKNSPEELLSDKLTLVQRIRTLVSEHVLCMCDKEDPDLELFECDGCISLIDGVEAYEDHLRFEEKRLTRRLVRMLLTTAREPGKWNAESWHRLTRCRI